MVEIAGIIKKMGNLFCACSGMTTVVCTGPGIDLSSYVCELGDISISFSSFITNKVRENKISILGMHGYYYCVLIILRVIDHTLCDHGRGSC